MVEIKGLFVKEYKDHYEHFCERLLQRYGLVCKDEIEYDAICKTFKGIFCRNASSTLGIIRVQGVKVWCLYNRENKWIPTVYPHTVVTDMKELITCCFSRPIRHLAFMVYEEYLKEKETVSMDFETQKDAAIFYFNNTIFAPLHIETYLGQKFNPFKLVGMINNILLGKSRYASIKLTRNERQ